MEGMEQEFDHRNLLTDYLLGKLNEEGQQERRDQAERYFEDDALFDELLDVEAELLDQYVRGKMAPQERAAFADYLNKLPDGRDKEAFAATLLTLANKPMQPKATAAATAHSSSKAVKSSRPSFWQSLSLFLSKPPAKLRLASAIGVLILTTFGLAVYQLYTRNQRLQVQLVQTAAEATAQQQQVQELQRQAEVQSSRIEELQKDLEREQQRHAPPAREIAQLKDPSAFTAELELTPASRSISTPDDVILTRNAKPLTLTVRIRDDEKYVGHPAILQTTTGEHIQRLTGRATRTSKAGKAVRFRLPPDALTATTYKLTLTLVTDGVEISPDYYFHVVKR